MEGKDEESSDHGRAAGALVDVPEPQPKENWVVVKVHAAPMCTEYKAFVAGQRQPIPGP